MKSRTGPSPTERLRIEVKGQPSGCYDGGLSFGAYSLFKFKPATMPTAFFASLMEENVRRLLKSKPQPPSGEPWLVLDEVLSLFKQDENKSGANSSMSVVQFDMTHLGSLFVTNKARNGRFSLEELKEFGNLLAQFHEKYPIHEVQMRLRAHCTMELWAEASHSPHVFVDWFCRLAVENSKEAVRKEMVAEGLLAPSDPADAPEGERREIQTGRRRKSSGSSRGSSNGGSGAAGERSRREIRRETMRQGQGKAPGQPGDDGGPVRKKTGPTSMPSQTQPSSQVDSPKAGSDDDTRDDDDDDDDDEDDDDDDDDDEDDEEDDENSVAELQGLNLLREKPEDFVGSATIMAMHRMFQVQQVHDMSFQSFLDMMQQRGEDQDMMTLDDEAYDDLVPVPVIREFADNFLTGIIDLMTELHISVPVFKDLDNIGEPADVTDVNAAMAFATNNSKRYGTM